MNNEMTDVQMREGLVTGELVTVDAAKLDQLINAVSDWQQRAEAAEKALADAQSRLAHTQAGLTIWMERSKSNARELDEAYDAMCEIGEMLDCAEDWAAIKSALKETLRAQLAEVTWERDRLRVALIECAVPLEVLNAIDCELAPITQAGITAAVTAIRAALFSAQPEPKPEAPNVYQCPMCSAEVDDSTLGAMAAHVLMCGRQHGTAAARTFDAQPCAGSTLSDLALGLFTNTYRPLAIDAETIAENHRPVEHQLASLRFFDMARNYPTYAGLILFAKDLITWLPNAYVQYVRFDGTDMAADIASEKRFQGDLLSIVRDLNSFVSLITSTRPIRSSPLLETMVSDYPEAAVRELLLNAILHRSYEAPAPVRFYHYSDRIEIQNPGPLYGVARPDNFPTQTSYRNPVLAEALKTLGAINRFGRGVERARAVLAKNGNPAPEFTFGDMYFGVTIRIRP